MNFLFVHQSFPGQYRHIIRALASQNCHNIIGLGISSLSEKLPPNVQYLRYGLTRGNSGDIHPWVIETESKVLRGEACANAAFNLKQQGFTPDIICAHPGWGESLFLKEIFPETPVLSYQEFFYNSSGFDFDFDVEMQGVPDWKSSSQLRMKNANLLLSLESSDWSVTPTIFQRSSFPACYQSRISCIHDGIDTSLVRPNPSPSIISLPGAVNLSPDDLIVTFVNRCIEPYRGCHTFFRSIPLLQELHPSVKVVIVGAQEGVSYGKEPLHGSWKDVLLDELSGDIDLSRVHFTGPLRYDSFLKLLQLSTVHVYLTYPFVLSWSLLEAMSTEIPVVASSTPPVMEVISDGKNGLLVDFFSPNQVAESINKLLNDSDLRNRISVAARQHILEKYSLDVCLPQQLSLINIVASKSIG